MFIVIFSLVFVVAFGLIIFILRQQVKLRKEIEYLQNSTRELSAHLVDYIQRLANVDLRVAKLVGEVKSAERSRNSKELS